MSAIMNACSTLRATSRRRMATAVLLGVLAAIAFAPGEARAQKADAKATRTPYQAYLAADCLDGSNFCRFVSEEVPAAALLEIQRVACQGWHTSTMLPSFVVIAELRTADDTFVKRIDFHKLRISLNSGTTGVGSYGCTISGYLTPAS